MIIVKLQGGLGNQLFQYAVGRALSVKNADELILDNSFLNITSASGYTLRSYELGIFSIPAVIHNEAIYGGNTLVSRIRTWLYKVKCTREKSFRFMPEIMDMTGNVYLDGYWQTEKYFSGIADIIKSDLRFPGALNDINAKTAAKIRSSNAVSIHIRRTDYIGADGSPTYHNICSLSYYYQAMETILKDVPDAVFFIFSDDLPWAIQNLKVDQPHYFIGHNQGNQSYIDMYLMSICKHHIIANSSFSWWGAWLNDDEHKMVIAPEKWFTDPAIDVSDIIPTTWLKL